MKRWFKNAFLATLPVMAGYLVIGLGFGLLAQAQGYGFWWVLAMLVVYCLRNVSLTAWPHGLPELIAGGLVVGLHIWRRNTLLSITAGTVVYMLLAQLVFV